MDGKDRYGFMRCGGKHWCMLACLLAVCFLLNSFCVQSALAAGPEQAGQDQSGETPAEDGTYVPSFGYTGGSGRVTISCPEVTVTDGLAMAEICFDSSHYTWIRVEGETYDNENPEGDSTFTIPVQLNGETEVTAQTTAMSQPHEIDYVFYIYVNGEDVSDIRPAGEAAEESEEPRTESTEEMQTGNTEEAQQTDPSKEELLQKLQDVFGRIRDLFSGQEDQADVTSYDADHPDPAAPEIPGLTYASTEALSYAECFAIYHYQEGYSLIRVTDGREYLLIPEDGAVPEGLSDDLIVIRKPVSHIYLAATAAMSLFDAAEAMDTIRLSSLKENAWYIEDAAEAMEKGEILFAGKYSEPDYELILSEDSSLAIESTMILHTPEVQEKLEELGIPVFVDYSSYEPHPLGRTEWIRVYGELTDHQEEAEQYFSEQQACIEELSSEEDTGKTVAFFYINENGSVVVRKSSDYVAKMIRLAGGEYVFSNLGDASDTMSSGMELTMEEFYAAAKDADVLIYNATISSPLQSVEDLLDKSSLFADFKAVQSGDVWCTGKYLYQATDVIGSMTKDLHTVLTDEDAEETTFMVRLH